MQAVEWFVFKTVILIDSQNGGDYLRGGNVYVVIQKDALDTYIEHMLFVSWYILGRLHILIIQ